MDSSRTVLLYPLIPPMYCLSPVTPARASGARSSFLGLRDFATEKLKLAPHAS